MGSSDIYLHDVWKPPTKPIRTHFICSCYVKWFRLFVLQIFAFMSSFAEDVEKLSIIHTYTDVNTA